MYLGREPEITQSEIVSLKAYLTTIITRLTLDDLKSARVTREQYSGTWLPEPILTLMLAEINGSPAVLFWKEGRLAGVISLTLSAVGIQEIYALLNPEKLAYLQKQLSGRGTAPEASKLTR